MSVCRCSARVGAAAFVLGMSLTGPLTVAVASADDSGADLSSTLSGPDSTCASMNWYDAVLIEGNPSRVQAQESKFSDRHLPTLPRAEVIFGMRWEALHGRSAHLAQCE